MVLFGDGRSTYRDLGRPLGPAALAANFLSRSPANAVYAVAVGFSETDAFNDIVDGDPSLVHKVEEWPKMLNILPALVKNLCSV